MLTERSGQSKN